MKVIYVYQPCALWTCICITTVDEANINESLIDVEYEPDNDTTIQSAIVKYTDKDKNELTKLRIIHSGIKSRLIFMRIYGLIFQDLIYNFRI